MTIRFAGGTIETGHAVSGVPERWERRGNEFLALLPLIVFSDDHALAAAVLVVQPRPVAVPLIILL